MKKIDVKKNLVCLLLIVVGGCMATEPIADNNKDSYAERNYVAKPSISICVNDRDGDFSATTGNYTLKIDPDINPCELLIFKTGLDSSDSSVFLASSLLGINNGATLETIHIKDVVAQDSKDVLIVTVTGTFGTDLNKYIVETSLYKQYPGLIRWTVDIEPKKPFEIFASSSDMHFVNTGSQSIPDASFSTYAKQQGSAVGVVYGFDSIATKSTLLYWQDFSSLMNYFSLAEKSPKNSVSANNNGFGYVMPIPVILPPQTKTRVKDSYLYLVPEAPKNNVQKSKTFIELLGRIYEFIQKPETVYTDWQDISDKSIENLLDTDNWKTKEGIEFIDSYVHLPGSHPFPTFEVMLGLKDLQRNSSQANELITKLEPAVSYFLCSNRRVEDPWEYFHYRIDIARLALLGNHEAKVYMLENLPEIMDLAKAMGYEFYLAIDHENLKSEPPYASEYDAAGAYAYLMLLCYDMFESPDLREVLVQEAKNALKVLTNKSFDGFYSAEFGPLGAVAAVRLANITGDKNWIEYAYTSLSNTFLNSWLWESDYNYSRHYTTFFGVNTLRGHSILAAMEQHRCAHFVREFYNLAHGYMLPEANVLCAELLKYQLMIYRYTLPPFLPRDAVRQKPSLGVMKFDYYIPLESLQDGWDKSGQVGQEIYGVGGVFENAKKAYIHIPEAGVKVFCEYPIRGTFLQSNSDSAQGGTLTINVLGGRNWPAKVEIDYDSKQTGWFNSNALHLFRINEEEKEKLAFGYFNKKIRFEASGSCRYELVYGEKKGDYLPSAGFKHKTNKIYSVPEVRVLYIKKGTVGPTTLNLGIHYENNGDEKIAVTPHFLVPEGWAFSATEHEILPKTSKTISVTITLPKDIDEENIYMVTAGANDGTGNTYLRTYKLEFVSTEDGFYSDASDYNGWIEENTISPGIIEKDGNKLKITPKGNLYWGGVERKITVDLNKYRYLSIKISDVTDHHQAMGGWAILIKSQDEPFQYLQSETIKTGIHVYDLKDCFRGRGVRNFSLFVYSTGLGKHSVWVDWIKLSDAKDSRLLE